MTVRIRLVRDAMHHLRAWLAASRIEAGPLFRSVNRHRQIGRKLNPGAVSEIFKAMAKDVREPRRLTPAEIAGISGHSTRIGACQDIVRYGGDIAGAMQAGRWQTPRMVSRYCQGLDLKRGAVAQVALRRKKFV